MKRLFLTVVAGLAGCGAGVGIGDECSLTSPCGDGAVCDFTDPAGPVCIDADGDLDGDGISNALDFCNHAPGGAFDEDRDGIGDDCDRCPIAPPASSPDRDSDEVDSPCDPDPDVDGDQIVAYSGFNEPLPANWMATAAWEIVGGEAIARSTDIVNNEVLVAPLPLVSQHVAVFSQYRIDALDPNATSHRAGVVTVDQRPAGGTDVTCAGVRTGGEDNLLLDTTVNVASDSFMIDLFDDAGLYRLTLALDNSNAGCAMAAGSETGATTATTNGEAPNQGGLTAKGVTARFQYLLVVQRGFVDQN